MDINNNRKNMLSDETYAEKRRKKAQLIFRYKMRARTAANAAKKHIGESKGLCVLDIGSAEGLTLLEMRRLLPGGRYIGVEYSDELYKYVPQLPGDTVIFRGDICCYLSKHNLGLFEVTGEAAK